LDALQHGDLMVQRDCFQHQRGARSELASGDQDCFACRHLHESSYCQAIETSNESTRIRL
jgi:hypothetical protein